MSNHRRQPSPPSRQVMHALSVGLERSAGPPFFFLEQSQKGQRVVVSVKVEAAADLVAAILEVTATAWPEHFEHELRPMLERLVSALQHVNDGGSE